MPRMRANGNPESCWIRYKLELSGLTQRDIAKRAHRSWALVSKVINGDKRSPKVEATLSQILGYDTWDQLMQAARNPHKGGAA
jgi:hypothetical protein